MQKIKKSQAVPEEYTSLGERELMRQLDLLDQLKKLVQIDMFKRLNSPKLHP